MGETRVDLLHLLEDLRDAYPGALEETILSEIVANALDSGASRLSFATDPSAARLTAVDDGKGMTRRDLRRYHDLATTSKRRGRGIGFAGVGIKLGLLACEEVLTETRRGTTHVASSWHLKSRHKAPWQWTEPPGLVGEHGTAVRLRLTNPLSELLDEAFIEASLRAHFAPLFDPAFDPVLSAYYPRRPAFEVNGAELAPDRAPSGRVSVAIKLPRKRKPSALGYVVRSPEPLPESERGIAISTLGKVIKRGWDWLGLSPADADSISGMIEAPALADCLTLNKGDFVRTGPRGAQYLAYRKAIQEALAEPLAAWGERHEESEETKRRRARPLERDLKSVLAQLAGDFPLLTALTDRRAGGQKRLPLGAGADPAPGLEPAPVPQGEDSSEPEGDPGEAAPETGERPLREPEPRSKTMLTLGGRKRRAHLALRVDFESRPDDPNLGRLLESTIWVNEAHPAYRRALASRSQGYHLALTVAMTLAPLAVEAGQVHEFVTAFLERWGTAAERVRATRTPRGDRHL